MTILNSFRKRSAASALLLIFASSLATGCSQQNDALSTPQGQALLATDRIVKQSGGDWNKVSPADREILIKGPGGGSEQGAKSFLQTASARQSFKPQPPSGGPATQRPADAPK